jgi:hypothetical protein
MPVTPNTSVYLTGYGWSLTIGSTSWAQTKRIKLPDPKYASTKALHLSGLQVVNDGPTDFGTFEAILPQDGTASVLSTTAVSISATNGTKTATFTALITGDSGGEASRGATVDRVITADATSVITWT